MKNNEFAGKKVLVTGSAGFIPSHIAQYFVEHGAFVYGVDDLSIGSLDSMREFIDQKNFQFIQGDVCDQKLMESLVKKVDYVYHGAVRGVAVSLEGPVPELRVNTESTLILLEAMRKHGVERFVYPSSASVYGNQKKMPESETDLPTPLSPYGVSKLAAERYCIAYHSLFKIPVVCLRYFNTYGPRQRRDSLYGGVVSIFIASALQGKALRVFGSGKQTRDFTYIEDCVKATISAFTKKQALGSVLNIAGGKEFAVNFLAKKVKEIAGDKKLAIEKVAPRRVDNVERRVGDIRLAKKILGYRPKEIFEEGLRKTYEWNKEYYGQAASLTKGK